jgi:hypothetical protein
MVGRAHTHRFRAKAVALRAAVGHARHTTGHHRNCAAGLSAFPLLLCQDSLSCHVILLLPPARLRPCKSLC